MSSMTFKTTGTATYHVQEVPAELAEAMGCPGATHRILGAHVTTYGAFMATGRVPGREVRVPGWTAARLGMRAVFVPAVLDETVGSVPVDGYLAVR